MVGRYDSRFDPSLDPWCNPALFRAMFGAELGPELQPEDDVLMLADLDPASEEYLRVALLLGVHLAGAGSSDSVVDPVDIDELLVETFGVNSGELVLGGLARALPIIGQN